MGRVKLKGKLPEQIRVESIPYKSEHKFQLVKAIDSSNDKIIITLSLKDMQRLLDVHNYTWNTGSNGIWTKSQYHRSATTA